MQLPRFSQQQQHTILQAAAAILTDVGTRPLTADGAGTLQALARYIFRTEIVVSDIATTVPNHLAACFETDQKRQLGDLLFTILPLVDEVPIPAKVELSHRVLAAADLPNQSRKTIEHFVDNRVTRVRLDVVRATFADRYRMGFFEALKLSVKAALAASDPEVYARYLPLRALPEHTFGRQLIKYWEDNRFGIPGEKGAFPEELSVSHDSRHVLFGWDTTIRGEWGVSQNECGNMEPLLQSFVVASFINCQSGLRIAPEAPALLGTYDPDQFFRELERGAAAATGLMEPDWDYRPYLTRPLEDVRKELGIRPGGNVTLGQPWCGPDGPPSERDQPLHQATVLKETADDLVAVRISGDMTEEDIAFFQELIEIAIAKYDQVNLLVELQRFSGWASPKSLLEDIRVATKYVGKIKRLAVLGDSTWQKWLINLDRPFAALFGLQERYFELSQRERALAFCREQ
ncbi:MAG: STAS/SEC14 domain-containing protein [Nannocystaceae bacterium]